VTIADTMTDLRNRIAVALATKPIPEMTNIALANPVHTRVEVDETLANIAVAFSQVIDYHARQRAIDAVNDVDHEGLLRRYANSRDGKDLILAIIATNPDILDRRVEQIVEERIKTIQTVQVKPRNHFFFARMFSWLGMIIGAVVGALMGLVANYYLDAGSVTMTEGGQQYVGADIIDSLPGQIGIVVLLALACGAFGAALFNRRNDDN
jgi:hypothetical protein